MSGERLAVFRLEAGPRAGWGHLVRCAALAATLRSRGWRCALWSEGHPTSAPAEARRSFPEFLPAAPAWSEDIPDPVRAADWLVVDHYDVDDNVLRRLARALPGTRRLVLDDEGRRRLGAASLVLNARPGLERSPYAPGVPALLGERHALLRPGLLAPEAIEAPLPADAEGVLVLLGGTDPRGWTARVLEAIADVDPVRFAPIAVHPRASVRTPAIRAALDRFAASVWLEGLDAPALAGWARCCRHAVSAAGGTLHELALLRLPFVAIVAADNQRAFAHAVRERWGMPFVDVDHPSGPPVAAAFRALTDSRAGDPDPAQAFAAVDGRGADRVADALERA